MPSAGLCCVVCVVESVVSDKPFLEVVPLVPNPNGNKRVVAYLESLLEYAKSGKVNGLVMVTDETDKIAWAKVNVTYPMALGMLARCQHHINKEWDGYTP